MPEKPSEPPHFRPMRSLLIGQVVLVYLLANVANSVSSCFPMISSSSTS